MRAGSAWRRQAHPPQPVPIVACLALAGATEPIELEAVRTYRHPFRHVVVTTDAHAACVGAHRGEDGGVIVVGTGTVAWAVHAGAHYRVGVGASPFPTRAAERGSGANSRAACFGRMMGVRLGPVC